ncbi:hypothetcal protein [Thecamonas trahens ATCC 50062]|uniref:Hypothetcal protein n=1 Tax=Thecamonas trahens ATCC 50062 TaxID=461836 RepID=A0A0L0D7R9_THETB|nr:hypothetcal protein [Thecamonas trahens ATCC 50062]KNC47353.1 hypothetcal protein [Thecamonas trahens ATCC 50062]|eukprot:XP_013759691.1 hypothetcal protein [Thecamonas trahens ATCC 50062]
MSFLRYPRQSIKVNKKKDGATPFKFATLVSSRLNVDLLVELPEGEDLNEWLAINTYDFFTHVKVLYGTLSHSCTDVTCPVMSAANWDYLWADGVKIKKPIKVTAPQYCTYLFEWIQGMIESESKFPTRDDAEFSSSFRKKVVLPSFKRLSRVYAHMYYSHKDRMRELGLIECLDTSFAHFMAFVNRYELITAKKDLAPLTPLLEASES